MIYVWATLIGLVIAVPLAVLALRDNHTTGRHAVRRRSLRFGTAREIRRHVRGGRVLTHARTFRSRVVQVASHELTTRNARNRVVNLIADRTVEVSAALLGVPEAPTRSAHRNGRRAPHPA